MPPRPDTRSKALGTALFLASGLAVWSLSGFLLGHGTRAATPSGAGQPVAPAERYHSFDEMRALLEGWRALDPRRVEALVLPASAGGLVPPAIVFGADGPSALPLAERATVLLLGGVDGRSLAGAEAVLRTAHLLLSGLDTLRPDLAFIAVPWASPDGLARAAAGENGDGRDARAVDDDEDGRSDEDGPDDLDGDGQILQLLLEDSQGPYTFSSDRRFLVPAVDGDGPRLVLVPEGRDDDGDGRWNEDGPGGVQYDAHFPAGWKGPGVDGAGGRFPLTDTLARALADMALERRTVFALVFQGNHGGLARPGGTLAAELGSARERATFDALASLFARNTGRSSVEARPLRGAHGGERPGALVDWLHATLGAVAVEVAVWGPDAVGRDGRPVERRLAPVSRTRSGPPPSDEQRRWGRWLDDVRGGLDFANWRPVELGIGRRAWVGGWRERVWLDPPAELLPNALQGIAPFVREVIDGLPRLDIEVLDVRREGELVRVRARAVNRGVFPTGAAPEWATSPWMRDGAVELRFEAPCDEALLAGNTRIDLGVLGGGSAGREGEWLVLAPPGALLVLEAHAPACGTARRELRP